MSSQEELKDTIHKIRHSASHIMATAVLEMFPEAKLGIGPVIENGFYYDFDLPRALNELDLKKIEKRMKKLISQNIAFTRKELLPQEAKGFSAKQPYKLELINELIQEKKPITYYTSGSFTDLCGGPHIQSTKEINPKAFTLVSIAGAYWRGSEKNPMLQRIYGVAFETAPELEQYLKAREEAEKRDHRRLGQELGFFAFSELIGPGLPLYLPHGTIVMKEIVDYLNVLKSEQNYEFVDIPHLAKTDLYKVSGHWEKFKNDIFYVKGKTEEFVLKPMNCPHHVMIYAAQPKSYRDLPVRYAEVTKQYRDEQTGELHGLSRVRSITIDDTHIFCRPNQVLEESKRAYKIIRQFNKTFGFPMNVELSVRDPKQPKKYLGGDVVWKKAESTLVQVLKELKLPYTVHEGEAAFYGPKIDFKTKDSLGRQWQLSTIQLDFNLPERFSLEYINTKGDKVRPVMIHVAVAGSIERFLSIIIEHYAGAFPTWLSPVQVSVIPVGKSHISFSKKLGKELHAEGIRVHVDDANETVGYKIRNAERKKIPYMLVIGDKEMKSPKLHVRLRGKKQISIVVKKKFIENIQKEIEKRK